MELKNLESFIQVAELGSFTKAAARLGYTQSTVSFQIRQLEEELGTQLFERIRHTVRLTPKGREVLKLAHQMVRTAEDMRRTAGENRSLHGTIRMAMANSLCSWLFPHRFEAFHRTYPEICLTIITCRTEDMFQLLNQNEVDLVYTLDNHIYDRNYVIVSEEPVGIHFVASSKNPLSERENVPVEDLIGEPLILTEKNVSYRKNLDEYLARRSMEMVPFLELGETTQISRLVEQNLGISFLPDFAAEEAVQRGTLVRLDTPEFQMNIWKQLLCHRDKWVSPEMQAVMDYLGQL